MAEATRRTLVDRRLRSEAARRNREPILACLLPWLPERGLVLEVASGTGEHVVHLARSLPALQFQPSDPDEAARASIDAWVADAGLGNVRPALPLDASAASWPDLAVSGLRTVAVLCINMVHISPWAATLGLLRGASATLEPAGLLYLYGPYRRDGAHTAPSNAAFDANLRQRDPSWGVRDLEEVIAAAADRQLTLATVEAMPANNLSVIFRRSSPTLLAPADAR